MYSILFPCYLANTFLHIHFPEFQEYKKYQKFSIKTASLHHCINEQYKMIADPAKKYLISQMCTERTEKCKCNAILKAQLSTFSKLLAEIFKVTNKDLIQITYIVH